MAIGAIDWRGPVPAPNFTVGRSGNPISLVIDHWTDAPFESAIARFLNPALDKPVSAHYVVSRAGDRVQLVDDADTAYHAGFYPTNEISIGIEHEASPTLPPTDELYAASALLHAELAEKHGLQLILGTTVLPHNRIVPTTCPGTLDLGRIIHEAEAYMFTDADRAKLNRIYDHLEAYEPLVWTKRLQQWLAKAIRSSIPMSGADLTGPDVETGQPFK